MDPRAGIISGERFWSGSRTGDCVTELGVASGETRHDANMCVAEGARRGVVFMY